MVVSNPDDTTDFAHNFSPEQPVTVAAALRVWLGLNLGVDNPAVDNTKVFWHSTSTGFCINAYSVSDDPNLPIHAIGTQRCSIWVSN
jgi:hypothetical protein